MIPNRTSRVPAAAAVLALAALAAGPAAAQLPRVHVIATGGTIASRDEAGPLTGEQLVRAVPQLGDVARISVEQFSNVGSSQITPDHWLRLARRIDEVLRGDPAVTGVVVTHGTDTMEETAFFLDLTLGDERPVVVTGSMRPPDAVAPEGAANLLNAVRLAASPDARGRGALVLMNDEVFAARDATKASTTRLDAFVAPGGGPIGVVDPDAVVFRRPGAPRQGAAFPIARIRDLPRVDVAYSYAGADGAAVDAFARAGARGIVLASVGRGNLPAAQYQAARRVAELGVVIVDSSRTGGGRVPAAGVPPGLVPAGDLNPQKARVLLMLALADGRDAAGVAEVFPR